MGAFPWSPAAMTMFHVSFVLAADTELRVRRREMLPPLDPEEARAAARAAKLAMRQVSLPPGMV